MLTYKPANIRYSKHTDKEGFIQLGVKEGFPKKTATSSSFDGHSEVCLIKKEPIEGEGGLGEK